MKHMYPYNLMMPKSKRNDAVKGAVLLGSIVMLIVGLYVMAPDHPYASQDTAMMNTGDLCLAYPEIPQCMMR